VDDRQDRLFDELAVVGKAFGSPKRLRLVELLAQRERGVEELARAADMGLSTVSAHLQVLKASNLVDTRRAGTKVLYRLAGEDVLALYASMRTVASERSADVARALDTYFNVPGDDAVDTVTRDAVEGWLDDPGVALLDVRPAEEYAAGHLPGARSAPLASLAELAPTLGAARDVRVVTYCRGAFCVMAHDAVRILGAHGVAARRMEGGMLEWRSERLPVEVVAT
jgi:rhodanese-related sulfurtransferase/DNA-binding transcriptional ArsR family regulator